jgi:UDP-GlcNAc:undecaprenyl-phosphate GlcNAc-1-phosphate transferase
MTGRVLTGHSPFKADRNHIHHRLLTLGLDHHEAVMIIYLAQAAYFVAAWFMRYESDIAIVLVFVAMAMATLLPLYFAQSHRWRWRARTVDGLVPPSGLRASLTWLAAPQRLPLWCVYVIAGSVCVYSLIALYAGSRPPIDTVLLVGGAAAVLAINNVVRWQATEFGWVDRSALYLCAVLLVYLNEMGVQEFAQLNAYSWIPIIAIALAVAVRMRLSLDRRFIVTPLDVLVVVTAIVIPNLPDSIANSHVLAAGVIKLVVLFYGIETLSVVAQKRWKWLSVGVFFVMIACVGRGLSG